VAAQGRLRHVWCELLISVRIAVAGARAVQALAAGLAGAMLTSVEVDQRWSVQGDHKGESRSREKSQETAESKV
jgi:hypothetical protein